MSKQKTPKLNLIDITTFGYIIRQNPEQVMQYLEDKKISYKAVTADGSRQPLLYVATLNKIDPVLLVKKLFDAYPFTTEDVNQLVEKVVGKEKASLLIHTAKAAATNNYNLDLMKLLVEHGATVSADDNEAIRFIFKNKKDLFEDWQEFLLKSREQKQYSETKSENAWLGFFKAFFIDDADKTQEDKGLLLAKKEK